jgi:predicted small secreted protein
MATLGKVKFAALPFQPLDLPMRKILILAAAAAALMVSACNTVEGMGRDVSAAGRAVSNTAHDAK